MVSTTASPTCDATTGYTAGSHGFTTAFCSVTRGLRSHLDRRAIRRHYCAHHESLVVARFGRLGEACIFCGHTEPIGDGTFRLVTFEGGTCPVCDTCWERGEEGAA